MSTLLRAWRGVIDRAPGERHDRELIIVGDGPLRARLERSIHDLELSDCARLIGALPRAGVIEQLQQASVFALPVRTRLAGLNPEGLGLAALEAASCGLPVIVGDSGGAPETVRDGETGFVVPSRDHQQLAERLSWLLDNPQLCEGDGGSRPSPLTFAHRSRLPTPSRRMRSASEITAKRWSCADLRHAYAMARGGSDERQYRHRGKAR